MVYNIEMKKSIFVIFVFSLVLFSCDFFDFEEELKGNFWAIDLRNDSHYRVDAELLYTGTYCTVWAEKGSGVTGTDAQQFANEYDNNIYQKMINAFGNPLTYSGLNFSDPMKFADWLGDGNGKLCILLLDIKDNYKKDVDESYVAGYFWGGDLLKSEKNSNLRDMMYIDTYPGLSNLEAKKTAYKTFAHEMQHLMNFVTSIAKRYTIVGNTRYFTPMHIWIDEGLASAAEWVYDEQHSTSRINWFKIGGASNYGLINKGNNFFVWNNRTEENIYANQDDYSTVYLFFQWLRLQDDGTTNIYKKIIASSNYNHLAVVDSINSYSSWDTLLKTWLAANYINASSGQYGYSGDSAFAGMKAPVAPAGTTSLNLFPGEGVYSITSSSTSPPSGQGTNIRNTFLSATGVNDSTSFNGGALLTYNVNTNIEGARETGVTTGVAANQVMRTVSSSVPTPFSGPFVIDARDLRRIGWQEEFSLPVNGNAADE
jgi:hypothetical protein